MKKSDCVSFLADPNSRRSCLCSIFPTASLLCLVYFIGSAFIAPNYKEKLSIWGLGGSLQNSAVSNCGIKCRPYGSEALPEGIVSKSSNLEMRPLWGSRKATYNVGFQQTNVNNTNNLFAMAVGIKQKVLVNKMVKKFLSSNFVVMLFHYDGIVDEWKDFEWSDHVIHISAVNQTKWWFAKRFLHPDIVAEYSYIFLWDEDLGVEDFHPEQYVSIIISEGLEISQPALDRNKSEVHHQITARGRRTKVHRRTYKPGGGRKGCDGSSTAPPCTGWIEMMAPVFSRAAWRCVWYMIQNDLIHAWGLDMQLGYCAQGDRTKNVGVVDAEYIVHYGRPTLGGNEENEASSHSHAKDHRVDVRRQSYIEYEVFRKRWKKAVEEDKCWTDPYPQPVVESIYF
ncbi:uncharacterized protein LOC115991513 isoform X1 [Quercus lobata]|uniref:uncharacterized protein LOC115991513 isoform X1 n=1 Tax=Quercus lobata TaxID=97700 RepID=UPI0012465AAE|nr:uncharacterized protein LOC115991513 isoform X1 [Quercus lobata]XP_030971129.1 uncharacterized protein LOC115991513 isoform X1 [Quercus lobata]